VDNWDLNASRGGVLRKRSESDVRSSGVKKQMKKKKIKRQAERKSKKQGPRRDSSVNPHATKGRIIGESVGGVIEMTSSTKRTRSDGHWAVVEK